jgi:hypothetical protein
LDARRAAEAIVDRPLTGTYDEIDAVPPAGGFAGDWRKKASALMTQRLDSPFDLDVLAAAPALALPAAALDQTVGWSAERQRPVSLREYIASRAPRSVRLALHVDRSEATAPVKRATELTDEELRETTCAILREGTEGTKLAILGQGLFSAEELEREVREGTPLGIRLQKATKRHLALLQGLVEAGKLRSVRDGDQPAPALPAFEF